MSSSHYVNICVGFCSLGYRDELRVLASNPQELVENSHMNLKDRPFTDRYLTLIALQIIT